MHRFDKKFDHDLLEASWYCRLLMEFFFHNTVINEFLTGTADDRLNLQKQSQKIEKKTETEGETVGKGNKGKAGEYSPHRSHEKTNANRHSTISDNDNNKHVDRH